MTKQLGIRHFTRVLQLMSHVLLVLLRHTLPVEKVCFPKGNSSQKALLANPNEAQIAARHVSMLMPRPVKSGSAKLTTKRP